MINIEKFTERLQNIIKYYDESASSFAEKIGVQRSSISHILSGRNKPSLDFIMKVLHAYPEVDLYWLINGKGEFPSQQEEEQKSETKLEEQLEPNLFSETRQEESKTPIAQKSNPSEIDKIIIFYKDGSFDAYQN